MSHVCSYPRLSPLCLVAGEIKGNMMLKEHPSRYVIALICDLSLSFMFVDAPHHRCHSNLKQSMHVSEGRSTENVCIISTI